jgi:hypothetical protein
VNFEFIKKMKCCCCCCCCCVDLQADFRRLPESTRAVVGDPARFHCLAPRGQPEPEVTWRKNGVPIEGWDDELGSLDKERL